ncbi:hypothetical protein WN51_06844 [Melipona quadrifasciata]|uniref:Uncharacterized protein n=1 Tax=Melipona quadrifasciata TaxID=166423 RepID=A0A0N0U3C6_9HYME|nr:hypothetical protein WN51_06844 [Melipona quadrifasciata]
MEFYLVSLLMADQFSTVNSEFYTRNWETVGKHDYWRGVWPEHMSRWQVAIKTDTRYDTPYLVGCQTARLRAAFGDQ